MNARRIFTMADQLAFAALSGDANPLHVDPVAARRTMFGGCVVHGIHGLLWALDTAIDGPRTLSSLEAKFLHGIAPGDEVECHVKSDDDAFALAIVRAGVDATRITGRWASAHAAAPLPQSAPAVDATAARELSFAAASAASGTLPLVFDAAAAGRLFPRLTEYLASAQLAFLLTTTRLVGMECPGLHSLYSGLKLGFAGDRSPHLHWRVSRANERFSSIEIAVEGAGAEGTLATFFRPPPRAQPTMAEVAARVMPGAFEGQRVLIVGGSRGMGEVAAKIFSAGGAQVCVSFAHGAADAECVAAETGASVIRWDVTAAAAPSLPFAPNVLCYFATPHIAADKNEVFSAAKFGRFAEYYVTGFQRAVQAVLAAGERPLAVLYPSTIFLDRAEPNMAEYCTAKAAGEECCRQLVRRFPRLRIDAPRLPRTHTDQTTGLLPVTAADPVEALLPVLAKLVQRPSEP